MFYVWIKFVFSTKSQIPNHQILIISTQGVCFCLNKRLLSSRLVLSTSKIILWVHDFFPLSMPGRLVTLMTPNESCLESCLVKIEIFNTRFPNKNCLGDAIPGRKSQVNIWIGVKNKEIFETMQIWVPRYPHVCFSQKIFPPPSPLRQAAGELLSRVKLPEVRGGSNQPTGEVPGWVGLETGECFFGHPSRSRLFWFFFFQVCVCVCVCLGVVVNASC